MRSRGTVVGLVGLLVLGGCRSVTIDDDDDIETSGAGPADAAAVGSGSGAGSTGSGAGAGGSASTGAGPEEGPLAWTDASTREISWFGGVGELAVLATPDYVSVPMLVAHREGPHLERLSYSLNDVVNAWDGAPTLVERYGDALRWGAWPERGAFIAAPLFGVGYTVPTPGWQVAINKPADPYEGYIDFVQFRQLWHDGPRGVTPDTERPLVRAIASLTVDGTRVCGYVLGDSELAVETRECSEKQSASTTTGVACADRPIPVATLGFEDRMVLAHAAGAAPCGAAPLPPDTAEVVFFDEAGAITSRSDLVPVGGPVGQIQVAKVRDSVWIAARVEGDDGLELARLSLDGALLVRTRLDLAAGRPYALATWNDEVVVVDAGRDADEASGLRLRVVDASGATIMTSAPRARSGREITTVAAVGSPDDDAVLVAFIDRLEENGNLLRYGVVRADVTGSR